MPTWNRRVLIGLSFCALYLLYFFGLDHAGMLGPDEPRYAAIGQSMAQTGDLITPRLWGEPWFEKPALLYWMVALGYKFGLNPDLAPRVPVAAASVAFLAFFFRFLRREYGLPEALYSTGILATSAGWVTYSHLGLTDLPLAVCFSTAMLLILPGAQHARPLLAGVFLGLAVLAKGLVPFALFLPALWFLRTRSWKPVAVSIAVAAPWYAGVIARNGQPFIQEFFWKHHFARFTVGSLQHVQPAWFYLPVLLAAIFPWTPLIALLFRKDLYESRRARFLLEWLLFGILFFSISENKLPGYLLPLLPAFAALLGIAFAKVTRALASALLAFSAALLCCIPVIDDALPEAILNGASHVKLHATGPLPLLAVAVALVVFFVPDKRAAFGFVSAGVLIGVLYLNLTTVPTLDKTVSARHFWRTHQPLTCVDETTRSRHYGLNYYAGRDLPDCKL